jgi:hypothetical protein
MFGRRNRHLVLAAKRLEKMDMALAALARFGKKAPALGDAKKLTKELVRRSAHFHATTKHMKNHVRAADVRMKKLTVASAASWSAFQTALSKSQKAFAKANRKTGRAFKHAVK